jgi:flagellar protein FlaG
MATDVPAVSNATAGVAVAASVALPIPGSSANATPAKAVQPVAPASAGTDVLQRAAQQVVAAMPGSNKFSFSFDKQSGMTIVKVFNSQTGELVRQIPTEEVVHIAQIMRQEEAQNQLLDVTA